jgi:hypothetical protein
MTALECVHHGLGPHTLDIANYFIDHGVPFLTLDYLQPSSQGKRNSQPIGGILGRRPKGYTFNLADYAAYTTIRDSYLLSRPNARAALCAELLLKLEGNILVNCPENLDLTSSIKNKWRLNSVTPAVLASLVLVTVDIS